MAGKRFGWLLWLMLLAAPVNAGLSVAEAGQGQQHELVVGDFDVELTTFAADGRYLLLWLVPGYGSRDEHQLLAAALADAGMAVWAVDLAEAQFLPRDRNAQLRIDPDLVAGLVVTAARSSGKPVVLMGVGGSAVPVLRGAAAWLARGENQRDLIGLVLLSPSLYRGVPELGSEPEYIPIVTANRMPVAVFQPGNRIGSQRLGLLVDALSGDGTPVYAQRLAGVGSLFAKDSQSDQARVTLASLPGRIRRQLPLLEQSEPGSPPQELPTAAITERPVLDTALRPFDEQPLAPTIALLDIADEPWRVDDYRDRVTVINFWASWCPPCVKEIPALNRLQQTMQQHPFRLISIDLGESPAVIRAFLQRVAVDFPVLQDSDGAVASAWRVIGLPSTFVIGPNGRIRFGANGAIEWDAPELVEQLRLLSREP